MKKNRSNRQWRWELVDPNVGAAGGDFAKLFRNQAEKRPGFLEQGAPGSNAYVMAREVIQNAWDAALELRKSAPPPPPPAKSLPDFHIEFDFRALNGSDKEALVAVLDLDGHVERLSQLARREIGLDDDLDLCLDHFERDGSLPILVVDETATTGMYGPWRGAKSKLYKGLASLGIRGKDDADAGGSFGYGKAGLIRGSAPRIVVAYTCFRERKDDPGVTRRLLGITYWDAHSLNGDDYTGMARWDTNTGKPRPFENEQADRIAERLGLRLRNPKNDEDLGSSFLILQPTVSPEALETAITRSWWPALEDPTLRFQVTIRTPDGKARSPRPQQDSDLQPFVRAYREATSTAKLVGKIPNFHSFEIGDSRLWGKLVLVTDPEGWSFPDPSSSSDESLVALLRNTRMIVEYKTQGFRDSTPIVRGVFVADDRISSLLRETEPFGHDAWDPTGDDSREAREIADGILKRIKDRVRRVRKDLAPPAPKPESVMLPEFDRIMRRILGGEGRRQGPIAQKRFVRLFEIDSRPEVVAPRRIRTVGSSQFALSENFPASRSGARIAVQVRFVVLEDGHAATANSIPVTVTPPDGFRIAADIGSHRLTGWLARGEQHRFTFRTDPYDQDWTGRLYVEAEFLSEDS